MHKLLNCRRSLIAAFSIGCLTYLGVQTPASIPSLAQAIALICMGVAGANSYQGSIEAKVKSGVQDAKV